MTFVKETKWTSFLVDGKTKTIYKFIEIGKLRRSGVPLQDSLSRRIANLCNLSQIVSEAKNDGLRSKYSTSKQIPKRILNIIGLISNNI